MDCRLADISEALIRYVELKKEIQGISSPEKLRGNPTYREFRTVQGYLAQCVLEGDDIIDVLEQATVQRIGDLKGELDKIEEKLAEREQRYKGRIKALQKSIKNMYEKMGAQGLKNLNERLKPLEKMVLGKKGPFAEEIKRTLDKIKTSQGH